ncbi:MAG: DUF4388 domain-containing protein [Deltaproteobacteria bacterium]|nr:DUF4388 domain-containing protein [Deltaproteobacteria bacterium]MBI3756084.1 DUF4388 domain-containing protein [Deltaproteobacteria bacterium]
MNINEGIKGRLRDVTLVDIIQILHLSRKSGAINMGSEQGTGKVVVENGNVVHAWFKELSGEEAFYNLLLWRDGEFVVEMDVKPQERTISQNVEALLLEGMRRMDEAKKGRLDKGRLFDIKDRESLYLIKRLIELGILNKKEI